MSAAGRKLQKVDILAKTQNGQRKISKTCCGILYNPKIVIF